MLNEPAFYYGDLGKYKVFSASWGHLKKVVAQPIVWEGESPCMDSGLVPIRSNFWK